MIKTIFEVFALSLAKVYPPESFNPITNEFNGLHLDSEIEIIKGFPVNRDDLIKNYYEHPIIMLASILGFSNPGSLGEKPAWDDFFRNMLDVKTLAVPVVLPLNLIKLLTELLARFLADFFENLAALAELKRQRHLISTNEKIDWKIVLLYLGQGACIGFQYLFLEPIHFIGRAITSPIKGIQQSFQSVLYFHKSEEESTLVYGLRIAGGIALAIFSFGITLTAYTFLLPLAVTGGAGLMGAQLHVNLPWLIALLNKLEISLSVETVFFGGIGAISAIALAIASPFDYLVDELRHWNWHRNHPLQTIASTSDSVESNPNENIIHPNPGLPNLSFSPTNPFVDLPDQPRTDGPSFG